MSQALQFMYNDTNNVRIDLDDAGSPWWVATDVGAVLGYGKIAEILKRLDDDEKGIRSIDTRGGPQDLWCINEPGLYSFILGSSHGSRDPVGSLRRSADPSGGREDSGADRQRPGALDTPCAPRAAEGPEEDSSHVSGPVTDQEEDRCTDREDHQERG